MVNILSTLHYVAATIRFSYHIAAKMSIITWLYLFVAGTAVIGFYCIIHIMREMSHTIMSIVMFGPKLYAKLVDFLMSFVDGPERNQNRRQYVEHRNLNHTHHHFHHAHSHNRQRTPVAINSPPLSDDR